MRVQVLSPALWCDGDGTSKEGGNEGSKKGEGELHDDCSLGVVWKE